MATMFFIKFEDRVLAIYSTKQQAEDFLISEGLTSYIEDCGSSMYDVSITEAKIDGIYDEDLLNHIELTNELDVHLSKGLCRFMRNDKLCYNISIMDYLCEKHSPKLRGKKQYVLFFKNNYTRIKEENPNFKHEEIIKKIEECFIE